MNERIEQRVNTYGRYLKNRYGRRVFRAGLSINRECPHRIEQGGCIFCEPESYTDTVTEAGLTVSEQLDQIIPKIREGCGDVGIIGYFHHNTSTAGATERLKQIFLETLKHNEILGLIISTRPDFLNREIMEMLTSLKGDIFLEIGLQTTKQNSLEFLNRGHSLEDFAAAIRLCEEFQIESGVHLLLGIPGETESDMLSTVQYLNAFDTVTQIKFHNLVVYKDTRLAELPAEMFGFSDFYNYLSLLGTLLRHTKGDKVISRFFTSNVNRTKIAINSFPGSKREWLNRLTAYLNEHDIVQGSATDKPFKPLN